MQIDRRSDDALHQCARAAFPTSWLSASLSWFYHEITTPGGPANRGSFQLLKQPHAKDGPSNAQGVSDQCAIATASRGSMLRLTPALIEGVHDRHQPAFLDDRLRSRRRPGRRVPSGPGAAQRLNGRGLDLRLRLPPSCRTAGSVPARSRQPRAERGNVTAEPDGEARDGGRAPTDPAALDQVLSLALAFAARIPDAHHRAPRRSSRFPASGYPRPRNRISHPGSSRRDGARGVPAAL